MKIIFVLLVANFFEANPSINDVIYNIKPEKTDFFQELANITPKEGTPLIEKKDPRIAFKEKQWLSINEQNLCPQKPCITNQYRFADRHKSGSLDLHPGHYMVTQQSGFVQRRPW